METGFSGQRFRLRATTASSSFYIEAIDVRGLARIWPAAALETNGVSLGPVANALYQVDDSVYTGNWPLYKIVIKSADKTELAVIGSASKVGCNSRMPR